MKLTPNTTYNLTILSDYTIVIKLLRLPNKSNTFYLWEHEDGRTFGNREQDVNTWVNRGQLKEI